MRNAIPKIAMDAIDTTRELSSVFSVILNFSLVEPYWQTTQRKCSEISKSSFLTAVLKKPRCATKKGTLKQEREANQCKVERRKITLSRFH